MRNIVKRSVIALPPMTERQFAAVARLFAVLAEPMRLRILRRLEAGPAAVSQIVADLGTTQANVSKHLKVLHDAGLLARQRDGNLVRYRIDDTIVFDLCRLVCDKLADDARRHPWAERATDGRTEGSARRRRGL